MKIEKLSLGSVKNVLSRAELKKIMAGSGGTGGTGGGGTGGGTGGGSAGCIGAGDWLNQCAVGNFQSPPNIYCCSGTTCLEVNGAYHCYVN